ncbi:MAG: hypothetical protein AABW50_00205 [Nanoarchaeota archaeon]
MRELNQELLEILKKGYLSKGASFAKNEIGLDELIKKRPELVPIAIGRLVEESTSKDEIMQYGRLLKEYKEAIDSTNLSFKDGQVTYEGINVAMNKIKERGIN